MHMNSFAEVNGTRLNYENTRKRSLAGISIAKRDINFEKSVEYMLNDPMWRQSTLKGHEDLKKMFTDTSLEWALEDMERAAYPPAAERLGEIAKETLLIIGSEDSIPVYEILKLLETSIKKSQKVIIHRTGHLPNLDKSDIFNKIVLDFLLKRN